MEPAKTEEKRLKTIDELGITEVLKILVSKTDAAMLAELNPPSTAGRSYGNSYMYRSEPDRGMYNKYKKLHDNLVAAIEEYCD